MFNKNAKAIKKLKKKLKHIQKVTEANNEFLAQIYEVMQQVATEETEEPKATIGFKVNKKQDD